MMVSKYKIYTLQYHHKVFYAKSQNIFDIKFYIFTNIYQTNLDILH